MNKESINPQRIKELFAAMGETLSELAEAMKVLPEEEQPSSLSVKEAAKSIGCSGSQVYILFRAGEIKGYRVGLRGIRLIRESVDAYKQHGGRRSKACA